jgi:hypothetical protein
LLVMMTSLSSTEYTNPNGDSISSSAFCKVEPFDWDVRLVTNGKFQPGALKPTPRYSVDRSRGLNPSPSLMVLSHAEHVGG